jgi:ketosteroid isomerase-like protein
MEGMSDNLTVARRLYAGFAAHDARAILEVLSPSFVGVVSPGMPLGVGGHHDGPQAMLDEAWIPVFTAYDVTPEADELIDAGDRVVAVGAYRGTERATGRRFEASFAHVLDISDGRISALRQITDTASWPIPPPSQGG